MKLFLTSHLAGTKNLVRDFLSESKSNKILFVPTASNLEEYKRFVDEAREAFVGLGFEPEEMDLATFSEAEIKSKISNFDIIYFSGGNTFYLLKNIQEKNLGKTIAERIKAGMLFIGESAGAVIASPNIEYIGKADKKIDDIWDFKGLSLVDFYTVPHFGEEPFKEPMQEIFNEYGNKLNLKTINNSQAIIVNGEDVQILDEAARQNPPKKH